MKPSAVGGRISGLLFILLLGSLLAVAAGGCQEKKPRLRVLCGSSMATPGQEIARTFADRHSAVAECDLGGSETLLPKVLTGGNADLFICHDPFETKVKDAGKWAGSATLGYLRPVLVVKAGNPKAIAGIADLARPDVKVGMGDPRYSTCGEMFVGMLKERKLEDAVMARVVMQARTHSELANGVIIGSLDAAIVWNFAAALYAEKLQVVSTDARYADVRVTVVGLTQSASPKLRDSFLDYCRSQEVQTLFVKYGYTGGD